MLCYYVENLLELCLSEKDKLRIREQFGIMPNNAKMKNTIVKRVCLSTLNIISDYVSSSDSIKVHNVYVLEYINNNSIAIY